MERNTTPSTLKAFRTFQKDLKREHLQNMLPYNRVNFLTLKTY